MRTLDDAGCLVFLGCGAATTMHARTLRRIGGVELMFASRDGVKSETLRRRFGGRRAFGSYEAALADPAVDVAFVATPTASHLELTLAALRAGKHVIVEKPAFMRSTDVALVRAAAVRADRRVLVAENYVYKPIAAHLRELIATGALGEVRFVTVNATRRQLARGWRRNASLAGGGALFEGGIHWIAFLATLGLAVEEVRGWRVGPSTGFDQSSLVLFRFGGGGVATLAYSWELPAPLRGLRLSKVQGTRGAVTFESNGFFAYTSGARRDLQLNARDPLGYDAMFRDLLGALREDARPLYTLDMAERDLRLVESALECGNVEHPEGASPILTVSRQVTTRTRA